MRINNLLVNSLMIYFLLSLMGNIFSFISGLNILALLFALLVFLYSTDDLSQTFPLKFILIILFIIAFQLIYIFKGQLNGYESDSILYLSRYLIMFLFSPIFYYVINIGYLEKLFKKISLIMFIYILAFSTIIINLNIVDFFKTYIFAFLLDYTSIIPYSPVPGFIRVFDSFAPFFPLIFIYIIDKSKIVKLITHIFLLIYIIYVGSIGIWVSYITIMFFYDYKKFLLISGIMIVFLSSIYLDLILNFLEYKIVSIDVKNSQIDFILSNLSVFGTGVGVNINIFDRQGVLIENLFLYWVYTYGILGFFMYGLLIVIYPLYITIKNKYDRIIYYIGLTYLSIIISSISNPYLMSGTSIMILIILISYDLNKSEKWHQ